MISLEAIGSHCITFKIPDAPLVNVHLFCFCQMFLLVCGILILCTIGAIASSAADLSDEGDEWTLKKNKHSKRDKAIREAEDLLGSFITQSQRSEDDFFLKLGFIYKGTGDPQNMFTERNLAIMKEVRMRMNDIGNWCQGRGGSS